MELGVLLLATLGGNVPLDLALAAMATDCADVIAIRPELPAPEMFFHRRHPAEHLPSRQTLDNPHHLGRAIRWNRLHQEVHVVPVRPDLEKP